ncbi:MAG: stage III sporulation AC/AD family protein [Oscillospiraceae bacterium]|nr:stage III sporulation AC/AD family protein [Oscillospiraceae bacterium]
MTINILQIIGVALTAVFFIVLIGRDKLGLAFPVSVAACLLLLGAAIMQIAPIVEYITQLGEETDHMQYIGILLRALGVALVCETTADICRDAGEEAIAGKVELFCKAQILFMCLPLLQRIFAVAGEILGMG